MDIFWGLSPQPGGGAPREDNSRGAAASAPHQAIPAKHLLPSLQQHSQQHSQQHPTHRKLIQLFKHMKSEWEHMG